MGGQILGRHTHSRTPARAARGDDDDDHKPRRIIVPGFPHRAVADCLATRHVAYVYLELVLFFSPAARLGRSGPRRRPHRAVQSQPYAPPNAAAIAARSVPHVPCAFATTYFFHKTHARTRILTVVAEEEEEALCEREGLGLYHLGHE